jgi:hypothetical protein
LEPVPAVFTLVDSIVLEPLTYHEGGKLVVAWERVNFLGPDPTGPNPRHVDLWQKRATAFSGMTLLRHGASGLTLGTGHPQLVGTVGSLANLFDVLQVTPLLGRTFLPEDGVQGHDNVAILTYPLWQSFFHGDPNVIGKTVRLADNPREVIGVLPANFQFPNKNALRAFRSKQSASSVPEPAIFLPAVLDLNKSAWNGEYGNWVAVARLKPGVGIKQAETQLVSIEAQVVREMPVNQRPNDPGALQASLQPMQEAVVGESRTGLWLLMAAVIGLMLIACVNLANAQIGRDAFPPARRGCTNRTGRCKVAAGVEFAGGKSGVGRSGRRRGGPARDCGTGFLSPPLAGRSSAFVRSSSQPDRSALFHRSHAGFERSVRHVARSEVIADGSPAIAAAG